MDEDKVTLISQDKILFELEFKFAKNSETIKNLVEDSGAEVSIPLNEVNGFILKYIVNHLKGEEFPEVNTQTLFDIILAANYLDIKDLLEITCQKVADMIRGKTPSEIRKIFGVENDFTPEEEEEIKKQNEWNV